MPFNTVLQKVMASLYRISDHLSNLVDEIKYLGVIMQSNCKFHYHYLQSVVDNDNDDGSMFSVE